MSSTLAQPIQGINAKVTVAPITNGTPGTAATLKNSKWTLTPKGNFKEAPNTTDGMLRAIGLADYEIKVEGSLDNQSGQQIELNVTLGALVQVQLYRDATHFWTATSAIITDFEESTGAEDLDEWSFTASKQGGSLTAPAYP